MMHTPAQLATQRDLQEVIGNSSVQMTPFLSIVSYNDCRYAVHAGGRVFIFASFG